MQGWAAETNKWGQRPGGRTLHDRASWWVEASVIERAERRRMVTDRGAEGVGLVGGETNTQKTVEEGGAKETRNKVKK